MRSRLHSRFVYILPISAAARTQELIEFGVSAVMDLAQGHVDALAALPKDQIFEKPTRLAGFGETKGHYKAYNLGKGKGMSVLNMVEAMKKASGFDYKFEIVGRR